MNNCTKSLGFFLKFWKVFSLYVMTCATVIGQILVCYYSQRMKLRKRWEDFKPKKLPGRWGSSINMQIRKLINCWVYQGVLRIWSPTSPSDNPLLKKISGLSPHFFWDNSSTGRERRESDVVLKAVCCTKRVVRHHISMPFTMFGVAGFNEYWKLFEAWRIVLLGNVVKLLMII